MENHAGAFRRHPPTIQDGELKGQGPLQESSKKKGIRKACVLFIFFKKNKTFIYYMYIRGMSSVVAAVGVHYVF